MFRVITGNVTVANLPDKQRAEYFTERFGGIVKRIRYKNPKFINYLKEDKTDILHEELPKWSIWIYFMSFMLTKMNISLLEFMRIIIIIFIEYLKRRIKIFRY